MRTRSLFIRGWMAFTAVLFLLTPSAFSDELFLHTGDLVEVIFVSETPGGYKVEMQGGYLEYKKEEVAKLKLVSQQENDALRQRWDEMREAAATGKKASRSKGPATLPFASKGGFFLWLRNLHQHIHDAFAAFPITAYFMNLKFIASYRADNPQLYIMAFYSCLLFMITPVVALGRNYFLSRMNEQKRRLARGRSDRP